MMEQCESWRRLGLAYHSISHVRRREHPARMVSDNLALVLFDRPSEGGTMVALWSLTTNSAVTSVNLPFKWSLMDEWDWRAEAIRKAFDDLCPTLPEAVDALSLESSCSRPEGL